MFKWKKKFHTADFIGNENERVIHEQLDIKNIEDAEKFAIITTNDNSKHVILEIDPIEFGSLSLKERQKIELKFFEFLANANFDMKIIKRVVNNFSNKLMESVTGKAHQSISKLNQPVLLKKLKEHSIYLNEMAARNSQPVKKYYFITSYHDDFRCNRKKQGRFATGILIERVNFIINSFSGLGLKRVIPLAKEAVYNLYLSYLKDFIYKSNVYATPSAWFSEFRLAASGYEEKLREVRVIKPYSESMTTKINQTFLKIKHYAMDKGVATLDELTTFLTGLSNMEKNYIISLLKNDIHFKFTENVVEYVPKEKSMKIDDVEKEILLQQKHDFKDNYYVIGNVFHRGLVSSGFADEVPNNFLSSVFKGTDSYDVIVDITPTSKIDLLFYFKNRQKQLEDILIELKEQNQDTKAVDYEMLFINEKMEELKNKRINTFELSLIFIPKAPNLDQLNEETNKILSLMKNSRVLLKTATNFQKDSFRTSIPTSLNYFSEHRIKLTNKLLAQNFPFITD